MARSSAKKTATADDLGARNGPWTGRGSCGSTTAICGPVGVGAGGSASPRGPRVMGDARGRSTRSRSACSFRGGCECDRARSGRPVGGGARRLRVASRVGSRSTAYASTRAGVHVAAPAFVRRWVTASAAGATPSEPPPPARARAGAVGRAAAVDVASSLRRIASRSGPGTRAGPRARRSTRPGPTRSDRPDFLGLLGRETTHC